MPDADNATQTAIAYAESCFEAAQEVRRHLANRISGRVIEPPQQDNNDLTIIAMAVIWHLHLQHGISWDAVNGDNGLAEIVKQTVMMAYGMGELSAKKEQTP